MTENDCNREIVQRLGIIICLLLDAPTTNNSTSIASKVHKLSGLGLTPSETAKILGKPVNYITAIKATKRAREGKRLA
jgi:hypothetical protein